MSTLSPVTTRVSRTSSNVPQAPADRLKVAPTVTVPSSPTTTSSIAAVENARQPESVIGVVRSRPPLVAWRARVSPGPVDPPWLDAVTRYVPAGTPVTVCSTSKEYAPAAQNFTARAPSAASGSATMEAPVPVSVHIETSVSSKLWLTT